MIYMICRAANESKWIFFLIRPPSPFQKTSFTDSHSLETHSTKYKVEKDFKSACMPLDIYRERTFRDKKINNIDLKYMSHKIHSSTVSKSEIWQGYVL